MARFPDAEKRIREHAQKGSTMTNETTASQPKITPQEKMPKESIGDDAQFRKLMNAWDASEHGADADRIYDQIAAYIDSRAPAAQASATIQAAPNLSDAYLSEAFHRHGFLPENLTGQEKFYSAIREIVATIKPAQVQPESRVVVLLKAACDMLKQGELTATSFYDEAECDGHCLLEDVEIALDDLAAATQAAPDNMQAKAWMIWLHGPCGVFENKDDAQLEMDRRNKLYPNTDRKILELSVPVVAATIQEPVMVADPVAYADPKAFENFSAGTATNEWMWAKPDAGLVPLYRAAQMVAAPAGVAALAWKWHDAAVASGFAASEPAQELFCLLGWPDRAATVKAVPSEALPQDEHVAFETWAGTTYGPLTRDKRGFYEVTPVWTAWCAWKARSRLAAPLAGKTGGGE